MAEEKDVLADFSLLEIEDNGDGWGPGAEANSSFDSVNYAPFNKMNRIGRVSDWNNEYRRRHNNRQQFGQGLTDRFRMDSAIKDMEDGQFKVVDNIKRVQAREAGRKRYKKFSVSNRRRRGRGYRSWTQRFGNRRRRWNNNRRWNRQNRDPKSPSINVLDTWTLIKTLELGELPRYAKPCDPDDPETLVSCGALHPYNPSMDRLTPRKFSKLKAFENTQHFTATTSDDPVMQKLMKASEGTVYGTDTIIALLMSAPRSVNSWDLIVRKKGDTIIFDKRPESRIDYITVNENWNEVIEADEEAVNHPTNLSIEASVIGQNFSQQVLNKDDERMVKYDQPNPFAHEVAAGDEAASAGYKYRRFDLGDGIHLVCRSTINAYHEHKGEKKEILVRALNEFDSKLSGNIDWRQRLEQQLGAVLANEMKNNACKLSRWNAEVVLSGVPEMRLGFVTRQNTKDSYKHIILKSHRYKAATFATNINVKSASLWKSLRNIIDLCREQPDGEFLLLKDANKPQLHMYSLPADSLDRDGEVIMPEIELAQ